MKNPIQILFFHHVTSNFVKQDEEILSSEYNVSSSLFSQKNVISLGFSFLKQLFIILKSPKKRIIFVSEFASYHSWLPSVLGRLFSIPHVIFLHGADVNVISSINYGHNQKWPLKWFNINSLRLASHLVPVSSHLIESRYSYIPNESITQGLVPLLGDQNLNITVIPNGISTDIFENQNLKRIHNSFLVVCSGAENHRRAILKGLDLVFTLATQMKSCSFSIVGFNSNSENNQFPPNVTLLPLLSSEKLVEQYNRHQFFLQLSLIESFGLALCEAMLCGCVPIISDIPALVEVVDNQGYVLKRKDPELLYNLIIRAVEEYEQKPPLRLNHINKNYSISQRRTKIKALFKSIEESV